MKLYSRAPLAALTLLMVACGDTTDHVGTTKPAVTDTVRSPSSEAPKPITSARLFRLDPKTSISYDDRDRTDEEYFHGFSILATATPQTVEIRRTLDRLHIDIGKGVWNRDQVREANYGISLQTENGVDDLLICTYCVPPVVARPANASETELTSETAAALGRIISSVFPSENGT